MTINISLPNDLPDLRPRITVIGVGGAGGNAVNNMIRSNLEGVEFIATNTDSQALQQSLADRRIQLGQTVTQGLGAGSRPDVGRAAAEEQIEEILTELGDSNMVFITAGMGGGTGSGAAPVIAQAAGERDILTVGVVTKPFHFEGANRMRIAEQSIEELSQYVDTLIIIPNQNLFRIANEKTTFADAFNMADDVLHSGVRGVTDLMVMPGMINLDFADIRTVMSEMGKAMMGTGEAEGEHRAREAAEAAINNPLLDDTSMKGARGMLINITGGYDMTLFEVDEAANRVREEVDNDANIIFGSTFDEKMSGTMRVSVVATGINAESMAARPPRSTMSMMSRPAPRAVEPKVEPEVEPEVETVHEAPTVEEPVAAEDEAAVAVVAMAEGGDAVAEPNAPMAEEPEQLLIPETALEAAVQSAAMAAETAPSTPAPVEAEAAPRTATDVERERVKDAFMPQPAMTPRTRATAPAGQPSAFEAAAMANAGRTGGETSRQPQSLLQKVTGLTRRYREAEAATETPATEATSEPASPTPIVEPAPGQATQQRLGALDRSDRVTASQASDDLLDIPAFLRRQAS